jgi:hypothetical protein
VDTVVRVTVDSQALRALVHLGGEWNIRTGALPDGTYTVTAAVSDPAGNEGTDSQSLTVDTAAPAVTIDGGASALTDDATPIISGTADVPPGTTVTVTLADETLTGQVQEDGTWSVTSAALSDATHRVVVSAADAAGNDASSTQMLTVDTASPVVTITGGTTATTRDADPTITGTSDAVPGTTITVSIADQTMTALVQNDGSWNTTPSFVGEGTWSVVASVPDPAGNVGTATQMLTIDTTMPETDIVSGPTGTDAEFTFSSSETGSSFECKMDDAAFSACTSPISHIGLADGEHTFSVRATDTAGNVDPTSASQTFTVNDDVAQPNLNIGDGTPSKTTPSKDCTLTVTRSGDLTGTTDVDFATLDGSAKAGKHYVAQSDTLTFAPDQGSRTIVVDVLKRTSRQRRFSVELSNATGGTIVDGSGKCTIKAR